MLFWLELSYAQLLECNVDQPAIILFDEYEKVYDSGFTKIVKDQHISFNITHGKNNVKGIGYNMPQYLPIIKSGRPFDVVFHLQLNEWQGQQSIQLHVIDIRPSA